MMNHSPKLAPWDGDSSFRSATRNQLMSTTKNGTVKWDNVVKTRINHPIIWKIWKSVGIILPNLIEKHVHITESLFDTSPKVKNMEMFGASQRGQWIGGSRRPGWPSARFSAILLRATQKHTKKSSKWHCGWHFSCGPRFTETLPGFEFHRIGWWENLQESPIFDGFL